MINKQSKQLFAQAQQVMPGGVNSSVRAFHGVGGEPVFIQAGQGPYMMDVDGNRYIDYVGSWGPLILGHAHPDVLAAVQAAAEQGLSFGAPCPAEVELAMLVRELMPEIEMLRCVNSGTEATMTAIRLARGITGRDKIIKFAGCYHGHSDSLLAKAGSGLLTLNIPSSPGVPQAVTQDTLTATFNDLGSVEQCFANCGDTVAAVIIEPIAGNMNFVPAQATFLQGLRELCDQYGALLIFDEVMSGFRVGLGGAQAHYNISPDLTTLGKVMGGGMPVGAVGGPSEWMQHLAPVGDVYQAGTLSGNPVAMAAGIATLKAISAPGFFTQLSERTQQLTQGLEQRAAAANIPFHTNSLGGMFGCFFSEDEEITTFEQVQACHIEHFKKFFHGMLRQGVYLAPSAFEVGFVSSAHESEQIQTTLDVAESAFAVLCES